MHHQRRRGAPYDSHHRWLEYQLFVLLSVQWGTYSSALPAMKNQVRETLRLVEEVTYDLTSQSEPRPHPA